MGAVRSGIRPMALLRANAVRKGVMRGSGPWTVVAVVLWAPKVLRWLFGRRSEVLGTVKVAPGEAIRIDAVRAAPGRRRTSAKSAR